MRTRTDTIIRHSDITITNRLAFLKGGGHTMLKKEGASEPIYSNPKGWFRYNYDISRLEFLDNETKMIIRIWEIPAEQWENLPSQWQYCKNIVDGEAKEEAIRQQKKQKYQICFGISLFISVIFDSILTYEWIIDSIGLSYKILPLAIISSAAAALFYGLYKES